MQEITETKPTGPERGVTGAVGEGLRDRYAQLGLSYIPRLLHLIDRNRFSRTYGSFDRAFWHYRTMDFPCGMAQEFALPLALVYAKDYPGNRYKGVERVRELAEAAVRFAATSSHPDGTCDDYFPFERAMGALVFSLYACAESYQLLGMKDDRVVEFFSRRVAHLDHENETGRLTNHQAFAALAAYTVFQITGDPRHKKVAEDRVALTLEWFNEDEGWFWEYEGADPGYQSCTIDFLAKYMRKSGDTRVLRPLVRASEFCWHFMHPDGSYAGEYGSRNTYHFYPHGFEILAPHSEKAAQVADTFLRRVPDGKRYINDDDRMQAHYVYNFLQAYEDYCTNRPPPIESARQSRTITYFPKAGMVVAWSGERQDGREYHAAANLTKGGVVKLFNRSGPIASDTGLTGRLADGTVAVSHLVQRDAARITADVERAIFTTTAPLCKRRANLPTPLKNLIFRCLLLTVGRFNANLTRSLLQKILITGKPRLEWEFSRTLRFEADRVVVEDRFPRSVPWSRLSVGSDATSIYVANSNVFQESVLCPWQEVEPGALPTEGESRVWKREYYAGSGHGIGGDNPTGAIA